MTFAVDLVDLIYRFTASFFYPRWTCLLAMGAIFVDAVWSSQWRLCFLSVRVDHFHFNVIDFDDSSACDRRCDRIVIKAA